MLSIIGVCAVKLSWLNLPNYTEFEKNSQLKASPNIPATVWQVISVESPKSDFKFCDSNQSRGLALLHKQWYNRYTCSRSSLLLSHT